MKKSMQAIEDYYIRKGLGGSKLRQAVQRDNEYVTILKQRQSKLHHQLHVESKDKKRYALPTDLDYEILGRIYELEHKKLSTHDRELIALARTQLEHQWRTAILKFLNRLLKKYK